jgi:periplasmic protein CpxP/Spy
MSIFRWLTLLVFVPKFMYRHLVVVQRQSGDISTHYSTSRRDANMSYFTRSIAAPAPFVRSVAIAALLGATMLATPLTATHALAQAAATPASATAAEMKGETVEQRITTLHAELKITPAEEAQWNNVAQAMRENASAMEKLVAANRTTPPQSMTAVQDLQSYQQFAQAHVDGLKNLTSAFSKLYDSMDDAQKKTADQVFQTSGHAPASHS